MQSWQKLSSAIVHTNPWYKVRRDEVIRPDGQPGEYYVIETNGASVFIVATNPADEILLIGMERYTNGTFSWEVPGGNSDGQDPARAALRELQEETGYTTDSLTLLGKSYVMNGVCGEASYVFLAKNLQQTTSNAKAEEGITRTQWFSIPDIKNMIKRGEITDNQSIVALTKVLLD